MKAAITFGMVAVALAFASEAGVLFELYPERKMADLKPMGDAAWVSMRHQIY